MRFKFLSILMFALTLNCALKAMEDGAHDPLVAGSLVDTEDLFAGPGSGSMFENAEDEFGGQGRTQLIRRSQSCSDLHKIKEQSKGCTILTKNASKSDVKRSDVMEYLTSQLGAKKAEKISQELTGKAKVKKTTAKKHKNKRSKKKNSGIEAFKKLNEEAKKENKTRTMAVEEIAETVEALGDSPLGNKVSDFFLDRLAKNGDAFRDQETMRKKAEIETTQRLACQKIEIATTRIDSREKWKKDAEARIGEARENANRDITINRKRINLIKKHPYLLVGIAGGVAGGYFAAKHGMKVLFHEIQRIIGIPTLAQDTSLLTFRERIAKSLGLYKDTVLKTEDLIFNKEFNERIKALTTSIKNTVENDGFFRNLLFYGVPGTGKTLSAKTIAKNSGLHYTYFAASGLAKLSEKDALNQVAELFEFAKRSPKKLMIIIDEAEVLFADRGNSELGAQMKKVLNLILTYTGTESKDYFVIALTNRPEDLDDAILSRCSEQIEFPLPNHAEIKKMLELYVKKLLLTPSIVRPTLYQKLFGKKTQPKRISIEPIALNNQAIDAIAKKIQGFVGRDISNLVIAFQAEAYAVAGMRLTKKNVDKIVDRKIEEKNKAALKFQKK